MAHGITPPGVTTGAGLKGSLDVALIGGGGVRTPLLIYGLAQSGLAISGLRLYDVDPARARLMASLGRELASFPITTTERLEPAIEGADFVLSSIRVGGIAARARDERIAIEHGLAGQETTGPGGLAMALRTVPVAVAHARVVEKLAPKAWLINFTNPAGLITQAINTHTALREPSEFATLRPSCFIASGGSWQRESRA